MCGIAGAVGPVDEEIIRRTRRMLASMIHRGPDQEGLWSTPEVVLGHRRLSILDLSEAGRQPMVDPTSGAVIAFNGECYNFAELRAELQAIGRCFRSTTDTEVILAAYSTWGISAIERLEGMFALAIWDPRDRALWLVRDRLGIKPLYYTQNGAQLLFSSEVRALLATGLPKRQLDHQALASFLWNGFVPGPNTLVQGIRLLEPGTIMRVATDGSIERRWRYWELPRRPAMRRSLPDAAAALERAVENHLVSDVPLGVFLSGGVDSSVIAAMAQRSSDQPVTTFNVRFEESAYDESGYARKIAGILRTDHREVVLSEQMFQEQLDDALECIDQPTFDAINTYFVSRAVREAGLTVALAGTGGDELFGGYTSFRDIPRARSAAQFVGRLPPSLWRPAAAAGSRILSGPPSEVAPQTRWGKLADVFGTRGSLLGLYQLSYGLFSQQIIDELVLVPGTGVEWGLYSSRRNALQQFIDGRSSLDAISCLELSNFLGERLLRDTDSASMAVSLEVRVPLLDHRFVEAVAALPDDLRFQPLGKKSALKEMVGNQLDPGLFNRPKAGFELPLALWCRQRLAGQLRDTFQDINLAHAIGLNAETVGRIWRAFEKGGAGLYWSRIWALFVLMTWCRRHGVYA